MHNAAPSQNFRMTLLLIAMFAVVVLAFPSASGALDCSDPANDGAVCSFPCGPVSCDSYSSTCDESTSGSVDCDAYTCQGGTCEFGWNSPQSDSTGWGQCTRSTG